MLRGCNSAYGMLVPLKLISQEHAVYMLMNLHLCIYVDLVLCKQACFDFARITTTVIDADIIPVENVIRSIACILCLDENKSMAFRYAVYV